MKSMKIQTLAQGGVVRQTKGYLIARNEEERNGRGEGVNWQDAREGSEKLMR